MDINMKQAKHIKGNIEKYSVVLVFSTSYALKAEKLLKHAGIYCKLIPVPRHLSSSCGVSVKINQTDKTWVLNIFKENEFQYESLVDL